MKNPIVNNLQDLKSFVDKKKESVVKQHKIYGLTENLGSKERRDIEEAGLTLAHNHEARWSERTQVGKIIIDFDIWLDTAFS